MVSTWCEVCAVKVAATILEGHYLCGGCALRVLERVSDQRADEIGTNPRELPADPWELPGEPV